MEYTKLNAKIAINVTYDKQKTTEKNVILNT